MKRFNSIEERRAYYAEATRRFRARRETNGKNYYDPEAVVDAGESAKEMYARGVHPKMIWAALDISQRDLSRLLSIPESTISQPLFFA